MIYVEKSTAKEKEFCDLLAKAKDLILAFLREQKSISPTCFETVVFEQMSEAAKGTIFEGTVRQAGIIAFPDVIANRYFGVEVKMTIKDQWTSTGNSVLESSRVEDVERIYIVFGKFGGKFDIHYRLYQECLSEISVTHSPRYKINMNLPHGNTIFDKIGIDYDMLRKDINSIQKIKDYYRTQLKEGEELWWIDQDNDDRSSGPIIRPFRNLSAKEKENFIVEALILFPEMFGNSPTKFERAAAYLIAEYNAVSAHLRDLFTAGGQKKVKVKGRIILIPRLAYNLYGRAKTIAEKIEQMDEKNLTYYWRIDNLEKNRIKQWKKLLDKKSALGRFGVSASDVFDAGLL